MFLKLTESLSIECYINVDFVSLYHGVEDNQDPVSVKLYTGCTIIFASYPLLLFVSKLQTEVTLFTIYDVLEIWLISPLFPCGIFLGVDG